MLHNGIVTRTILAWRDPPLYANYIILVRNFDNLAKTIAPPVLEKESNRPNHLLPAEKNVAFTGQRSSPSTDLAVRRVSFLDLAKSKLYEAQTFYDEFSGMNEVKTAQNKVIEIQDQMQLVQERRRHMQLELALVRKQLQDIHVELQKVSRGDHRYVELIKEEFDIMAREKEKSQVFQIFDQEERELFSHLTTAVKSSHEKERTQANNVKYWSIIASGVGAFLGIVAASLRNYFQNTQYETIRKAGEENNRTLLAMEEKLVKLEVSIGTMNRYLVARVVAEQPRVEAARESWRSYFRRHTGRMLRFFLPKA